MIFLFKDHSYKVYSPNMSDEKLVRKFEKKREDLEAILIETSTKLHSDTFILIKASNFKTKIEPFSLSYSIDRFPSFLNCIFFISSIGSDSGNMWWCQCSIS